MSAALFLCTEDTLTRPLPHVYQISAESNQLTPVITTEAAHQEAAIAVGNSNVALHDVRVKELRIIAQQQVPHKNAFYVPMIMPHTKKCRVACLI